MANQGITVASPTTTEQVAQILLAGMAAQSGIVTDFNKGSQIRTLAEQIGSVAEIMGVSATAIALQVIAYGGMSLFGITPNQAVPAAGNVQFATAFTITPPPAVQDVPIPAGTLLQTLNGVQFITTAAVTVTAGTTGIPASVVATNGGLNTNVAPGAINQILTGLVYPLSVTNPLATTGGLDAETPQQALTRLAAKFASLVGGSPVSVANSVIGVNASGTAETVLYSTCYEGWADPTSPNFPNTPNFVVFIDNGSGTASVNLIAAATTKLNGNFLTSTPSYRPAGMPYAVSGVVPVLANVVVSGALGPLSIAAQVTGAIATAVSGYFTLPFGIPASQPQLAAAVANAALGQLSALTVNLFYASGGSAVQLVSGALFTRVVLNTMSINVS